MHIREKLTRIASSRLEGDESHEARTEEYRLRRFGDLAKSEVESQRFLTSDSEYFLVHKWPSSLSDTDIAIVCAYSHGKSLADGANIETVAIRDSFGNKESELKKVTLYAPKNKR